MAYDESDAYESDDEILDTSWLDKFKKAEADYNNFYKEPVSSIRLYMLYINEAKEITQCVKNRCRLDDKNCLKRECIIPLIQHYQQHDGKQYKLNSLLRYNIDLNPEDIGDFVDEAASLSSKRFLSAEKYLDDIHYKDSITLFQNLNALYFIFFEVPATKACNQTRRIRLVTSSNKAKHTHKAKHTYKAKHIHKAKHTCKAKQSTPVKRSAITIKKT